MAGEGEWRGNMGKGFTAKVRVELKLEHQEGIFQTGKRLKGTPGKSQGHVQNRRH